MSFRPDTLRGAQPGQPGGHIDYRLARNVVIREFKKGRLTRLDVCDAHPELMRAARNVGEATAEECPICETANVVLVSYAFGSRLPKGGSCVTSRAELQKARRAAGSDLVCYVVEVCPGCSWNHLARSFPVTSVSRRTRA